MDIDIEDPDTNTKNS